MNHYPHSTDTHRNKQEEKLEGLFNTLYHEANDTTFGLGVWDFAVSYGQGVKFGSENDAIEWLLGLCPHNREVVTLALRERGGDVAETYLALVQGLM
jgi:hypothetical protein